MDSTEETVRTRVSLGAGEYAAVRRISADECPMDQVGDVIREAAWRLIAQQ
jgi:hypothetical protein